MTLFSPQVLWNMYDRKQKLYSGKVLMYVDVIHVTTANLT